MDLGAIVTRIGADMAAMQDRGRVADYIPQLGGVDPDQFGMAVVTKDGETYLTGDALIPFSIQSVSKVFTLAIALGRLGEALWKRVGVEPSGHAFNSILQLETEAGIPRNPFINAGALVVTDSILAGHAPRETLGEILRFVRMSAGDDDIHINRSPQPRFGAFYDQPWPVAKSGRPDLRHLFPPMRHRDELPATGARGPVSHGAIKGRPVPCKCPKNTPYQCFDDDVWTL